jgi:transposase
MLVGPGNESDYRKAEALTEGYSPLAAMADKGYDADWLVEQLKTNNTAEVVIPPTKNRKVKRAYNKEMYKGRNVVERAINKLKFYRRIATRYDKTARNFYSFICLAAAVINYK